MNPQPQSIYQRVIDRTKSIGFQTQFLAQSIDKVTIATNNATTAGQYNSIVSGRQMVSKHYS